MEASDIVNLEVCCSSDSGGEEERREIRKRKASLSVHKVTVAILSSTNQVAANNAVGIEENSYKSDHRILPRGKRRKFNHARALQCIMADYIWPGFTLTGKVFEMMFRVSRARFERMMFDIKRNNNTFYQHQRGTVGLTGNSAVLFEARLLLPLKGLAYASTYLCSLLPNVQEHGKRMRQEV